MKSANAFAYLHEVKLDVLSHERSRRPCDPLTDLWTRDAFENRLAEELLRLRRYHGKPLCLITVHLEELKFFSDLYSPEEADRFLVDVARLLRAAGTAADMTARIDEDEFALLLTETTASEALRTVRRIRRLASTPDARWGHRAIAVRVGLATSLDGKTNSRDLLSCAQVAQQFDD